MTDNSIDIDKKKAYIERVGLLYDELARLRFTGAIEYTWIDGRVSIKVKKTSYLKA